MNNDAEYCINCGEKVILHAPVSTSNSTVPVQDSIPKQSGRRKGRKIIIAVVALLLLAGVGIAVFFGIQAMQSSTAGSALDKYLVISGEDESFLYIGPNQYFTIYGPVKSVSSSMNGNIAGILTGTEKEDEGTLYVYNGKEMKEVADDVGFFAISDSGTKILFMKDYQDYYSATLAQYDVATGKETEISDDAAAYLGVIMSPDGESFAYYGDAEIDETNIPKYSTYLATSNGKPEKFGENCLFVALTDQATIKYYIELNIEDETKNMFFVESDGEPLELGNVDENIVCVMNRDSTEMLFCSESKTYFIKDEKDKKEIIDESYLGTILSPDVHVTSASLFLSLQSLTLANPLSTVQRVDVPGLLGRPIIHGEFYDAMISSLDSDGNSREIGPIESNRLTHFNFPVNLSSDNQTLCFINQDGELVVATGFTDKSKEPETIQLDEKAIAVIPSQDFSTFFVVDEDKSLFSCRIDEDPVELSDEVSSSQLKISTDGTRLYFYRDAKQTMFGEIGTLYSVSTNKVDSVEEIAESVYFFSTSQAGVVYYSGDIEETELEAFYSFDNVNFVSVIEEADIYISLKDFSLEK